MSCPTVVDWRKFTNVVCSFDKGATRSREHLRNVYVSRDITQEGALGRAGVDSSANDYASTRQLNIATPSVMLLMTSECINIQ